jgi:hypothetical protein
VVREYEDWVMEGRLLSPPARPLALSPGGTDRAEHVPAHDGGTDTRFALGKEGIVDPSLPPYRPII